MAQPTPGELGNQGFIPTGPQAGQQNSPTLLEYKLNKSRNLSLLFTTISSALQGALSSI